MTLPPPKVGRFFPESVPSILLHTRTNRFVTNETLDVFNERLQGLARVAPTVLRDGGLLMVKIMNPRHKGRFVDHAFEIKTAMRPNFDLIDELGFDDSRKSYEGLRTNCYLKDCDCQAFEVGTCPPKEIIP